MSNNKQSSVEFILNNIHLKDSLKWAEIIEQAKAMHKEEVKTAHIEGFNTPSDYFNAENYYNETFGGNNE